MIASLITTVSAGAQFGGGGVEPAPEPYSLLDEVGGSWVNLATFPVRPMAVDAQGNLWVVNHDDSTIERFVGTSATPDKVYGVPWAPVAIAVWNVNPFQDELLVVCRGTWGVVGLDRDTGAPKRFLQLRPGPALPGNLAARIGRMAEPGDILVDQVNDRAFVSCSGADSVVQFHLGSNTIQRVFHQDVDPAFRVKSPLFLSWDHDQTRVLCAPLHSGNDSLTVGGLHNTTQVVTGASLGTGLPDDDLFRIAPYVSPTNIGSVDVLLHGVGTILFAHGINPTNSDFWQLNTEALNTDPNAQSEPKVRGHFVANRVSIVQNNGTTWGTSVDLKGLDPGDFAGTITTANTVGQPFALAFNHDGYALITGSLTDNVVVLDPSGNFVMEWDVRPPSDPVRAIPRGILEHPTKNNVVYVYLWGRNEVREYTLRTSNLTATLRAVHGLRHSSTPPDVAAGRGVFFNATHSLEKNVSCASCHIEGGNDFLVWNLSNFPLEQKGPMFTQTLVGLERLAPFHWRGERQLVDFKPAFVGLLGAPAEPSSTDFERMEDYVFSLVNPANPNQNRKRLVDPVIHHPFSEWHTGDTHVWTGLGNAVMGQAEFQDPTDVIIGRVACVDCHAFPTGTNNDINVEGAQQKPRRVSMKPAPFHEGWRRRQTRVDAGGGLFTPFLGSGFSHVGVFADVLRFLAAVIAPANVEKANDVADFLHQWDQGLGLAVHYAYLLDAASASGASAELSTYLHGEMLTGNCDIAVLGRVHDGTALVTRRWAWDRLAAAYVCDDPAFANRSLATFLARTGTPYNEVNVFVGVPRGMAERFAIDYDLDGVRNLAEPASPSNSMYDPSVPANGETIAPGYAPGGSPEILWTSTKVARLVFTTNEPTTAVVNYSEPKTPDHDAESPRLSRYHSILLTGLRPSTDVIDSDATQQYQPETVAYAFTIDLEDARGNVFHDLGPHSFASSPFIVPTGLEADPLNPTSDESRNQRSHVVQEICLSGPGTGCDQITPVGGLLHANVDLQIAFKRGSWQLSQSTYQPIPAPGRFVVGRVFVERANGTVETALDAGLTVTPTSPSAELVHVVRTIKVNDIQDLEGIAGPQEYLAGLAATGSDGRTSIAFDVDPISALGPAEDLGTDDRILFNVEAVLEVNGSPTVVTNGGVKTITYPVPWRAAFMQWSFPDTMEARACVRSAQL